MKNYLVLLELSVIMCIVAAGPAGRNAGMLFYRQQPASYYQQPQQQYYPTAHQAMLVHYAQPARHFAAARRSSQETAAFAAGDTIGAGTFIQGKCKRFKF